MAREEPPRHDVGLGGVEVGKPSAAQVVEDGVGDVRRFEGSPPARRQGVGRVVALGVWRHVAHVARAVLGA